MNIINVLEILKNDNELRFEDEEGNEISCHDGWLYYNHNFMNISLLDIRREGAWDYKNGPYTLKQVFEIINKNNSFTFRNKKGDRIYLQNEEVIITGSKGSSANLSCDWFKEGE